MFIYGIESNELENPIYRLKIPVCKKDGRLGIWSSYNNEFKPTVFDNGKGTIEIFPCKPFKKMFLARPAKAASLRAPRCRGLFDPGGLLVVVSRITVLETNTN